MEELESYQIFVKDLADKKSELLFNNSGSAHASIVMSNIFRTAENEVLIFSGSLCSDITNNNEYLESLKAFLNRNGKLKVILETELDHKSELSSIFEGCNSSNIEIKNNATSIIKGNNFPHFAVADSKSCRLEPHESGTHKHSAICCFNNKKIGMHLSTFFDNLFSALS